jgi:hypothetical protein
VIYADPPWEYEVPLRGSPDLHYPVMPTEEICSLKIPAAKDAEVSSFKIDRFKYC